MPSWRSRCRRKTENRMIKVLPNTDRVPPTKLHRPARTLWAVLTAVVLAAVTPAAQLGPRDSPAMPHLPQTFFTAEYQIKVVPVATGLSHPWSLAFLPDGSILVTERDGRLRIVKNGVLDPKPIAGVPAVHTGALAGLLDIALHPKFAENKLVYLSYSKAGEGKFSTTALARGRFDGTALTDVKDIFVAN